MAVTSANTIFALLACLVNLFRVKTNNHFLTGAMEGAVVVSIVYSSIHN